MRISTILTGGLLSVALAGTAMAGPMGARSDMNKGGPLTKAELNAKLDQRFNALDTNGNGQIEAAEMEAAKQQWQAKRAERREARSGEARTGDAVTKRSGKQRGAMGAGKRGQIDANGDGIITREEFGARALALFDRADANGDGVVTQEERTAMREARKARAK
ncbi:MAG TPA: hypothetical protein VK913_01285 [Erythrobacter sp.]|nr:hypothetical protein [Erythrobacter sp.]